MVPKYILVGGEQKNVTFVAMRQLSPLESKSMTAGDYNPYLYIFEGLLKKNMISIDYIFIDKNNNSFNEWPWLTQVTNILMNSDYTNNNNENIWIKGDITVRIIKIKHEQYYNDIKEFQDYIQQNTSNLFLTRTEGANFFDNLSIIDNSIFITEGKLKSETILDSTFMNNKWPPRQYLISPTYMELEPGDMNTRNGLSVRSSIQFSSEKSLRTMPHIGPFLKPIEEYQPLDEELHTFIKNEETCYVCILITTSMKNDKYSTNKAMNEMNVIIKALTALCDMDIRIIIRIPNKDKTLFQAQLDAMEYAVSSTNYFETTDHIEFARLSYHLGKKLRPSSNNIWINQMGAGTSFYGLVNRMLQFRIHSAAKANDKPIIERSLLNINACRPLSVDHLVCAISNRDNMFSFPTINQHLTEMEYDPKSGSHSYSELLTWIVERKWDNQSPGHSQFTRWYLEKHPFYNNIIERAVDNIVGIQFSNDEYGMYLFCLTNTYIIVYCLTSHIIVKKIRHNIEQPSCFAVSYSNEEIVIANRNYIYLFTFNFLRVESQIFLKEKNVTAIAFSTDLDSNGIAYSANKKCFKKNIHKDIIISYDKEALHGLNQDILVMKYPYAMYNFDDNMIILTCYTKTDFASFYKVPNKYTIVHYDFSYNIESRRSCTSLVLVQNQENQEYEILVYDNNQGDIDNIFKKLVETIEVEDFEPTKIVISSNFKSCCIYSPISFRTYTIP